MTTRENKNRMYNQLRELRVKLQRVTSALQCNAVPRLGIQCQLLLCVLLYMLLKITKYQNRFLFGKIPSHARIYTDSHFSKLVPSNDYLFDIASPDCCRYYPF